MRRRIFRYCGESDGALEMHIVKNADEKTGEIKEALEIKYANSLEESGEKIEGVLTLNYSSETLRTAWGYVYASEIDKVVEFTEEFLVEFVEHIVVEIRQQIKEKK